MTPNAIQSLLQKQMAIEIDCELASRLARYLDLLLRWNARTNLSAIRRPETIVLRHFGESLQSAAALSNSGGTLLDYGSGAGFPGAVCALANPAFQVTLAESQNKKAAFLQELCRHVPVPASVHAGRVESMPVSRLFDVVMMRAVDRMEAACDEARKRVRPGGRLMVMTTENHLSMLEEAFQDVVWQSPVALRGTERSVLAIAYTNL